MTEIQGKSMLVRVSERSSYRESTEVIQGIFIPFHCIGISLHRGSLYQISLYIVVRYTGISLYRSSFNRNLVLRGFVVPRIDLLRNVTTVLDNFFLEGHM